MGAYKAGFVRALIADVLGFHRQRVMLAERRYAQACDEMNAAREELAHARRAEEAAKRYIEEHDQ